MRVQTDERGRPVVVNSWDQRRAQRVSIPITEILDYWRIDDEWWRRDVSRMYFHVTLESGQLLTLFQDLTTDRWYGQTSATPSQGNGGWGLGGGDEKAG